MAADGRVREPPPPQGDLPTSLETTVTVNAAELVDIARGLFATTQSGQELRLIDLYATDGELCATFAGHVGDTRGPYGIKVPIPDAQDDPTWGEYAATTLTEWVLYAVVLAAAEGYDTKDFASSDTEVTWLNH